MVMSFSCFLLFGKFFGGLPLEIILLFQIKIVNYKIRGSIIYADWYACVTSRCPGGGPSHIRLT